VEELLRCVASILCSKSISIQHPPFPQHEMDKVIRCFIRAQLGSIRSVTSVRYMRSVLTELETPSQVEDATASQLSLCSSESICCNSRSLTFFLPTVYAATSSAAYLRLPCGCLHFNHS
jgi:hypothetical protein